MENNDTIPVDSLQSNPSNNIGDAPVDTPVADTTDTTDGSDGSDTTDGSGTTDTTDGSDGSDTSGGGVDTSGGNPDDASPANPVDIVNFGDGSQD